MKNSILMFSVLIALLCSSLVNGNEPKYENISLCTKITATWCGPCGRWGWTLGDEMVKKGKEKALYLGLFTSSSKSFFNSDFYSPQGCMMPQANKSGHYKRYRVR